MTPKTMLAPTPGDDVPPGTDKQARATAIAFITKQLLARVGRPANLLMVQVRPLWDTWYRANLFVGPDVTAATIVNSYFLKVDGDGNIVESNPTITKKY